MQKERQLNWNIAFGLQAVDNLIPSKYMVGSKSKL